MEKRNPVCVEHKITDYKSVKMVNTKIILLMASFYFKRCHAHIDSDKLEEECKIAEICRHDQVAVCGIDSCGEMRTFIDTCDMHEFNCDSKKDYIQKPSHECWVTCKRGRSYKKPVYSENCIDNLIKT